MGSIARQAAVAAALLSLAVVSAPAHADNAALVQARSARSSLNYSAMIEAAERALRTPGNTTAELEEIYQMLGTGYGATREPAKSIAAFRKLLAINPKFKLPAGQPPKIRRPYQEAGSFLFDSPEGLTLGVSSDKDEVDGSSDLTISARIADPVAVSKKAVLRYQKAGGESATQELAISATIRFVIPKAELQPGPAERRLKYIVSLVDEHGGTLRTAERELVVVRKAVDLKVKKTPEPDKQVVVAPTPPPGGDDDSRPVYKKWWFWAVVGGSAAVLAGGGIWLGTRGSDGVDLSVTAEVR